MGQFCLYCSFNNSSQDGKGKDEKGEDKASGRVWKGS